MTISNVGRVSIYRALTMRAHHQLMKNRADMDGVIEGLPSKHVLLAAFLEATGKIDGRVIQRRVAIDEIPEAVNMEAHQQAPVTPTSNGAPFAYRRANLVRASE